MKLSFVVAAYNVEEYIRDCLNSILVLSLQFDYEVIVINDGSQDTTLAKIQEISNKKIRIINIENSGISYVRNLGIKEALGEYLYFLDGDDLINKFDFEKLSNELKNNYDILIGDFNIISLDNNIIKNHENNVNVISTGKNILSKYFLKTITPSIWKCFFKTSLLRSKSIYFLNNIVVAEDGEWFVRVLYASDIVYYNNKLKVYNYRLRNGSVMLSNYSYRKFSDTLSVIEELQKTVHGNQIKKQSRKIFDLYSISLLYSSIIMFDGNIKSQELIKIKYLVNDIKYTNFKNFIFLFLMRVSVRFSILIFKRYFSLK